MAGKLAAKDRTASQCEAYLDLLADVHVFEHAAANSILPIVRRLRAELEAAKLEEDDVAFLLGRRAKRAAAHAASIGSLCVANNEMVHQ